MNLHAIVSGAIEAVNPRVAVSIQISSDSTTSPDGRRTPAYQPAFTAQAQIQPLTWRDLQQLDGLNLQGTRVAAYLYGKVDGIVRATNQGGDLITIASGPYAGAWLVALVLEGWDSAGWCKVALTMQVGS